MLHLFDEPRAGPQATKLGSNRGPHVRGGRQIRDGYFFCQIQRRRVPSPCFRCSRGPVSVVARPRTEFQDVGRVEMPGFNAGLEARNPKPATKWAYPAYGETARRTSFAQDRTLLAKDEPKKTGSR